MRARPPTNSEELHQLLVGGVVDAAIGLIGCRLVSPVATLIIVETEAYHQSEPACHGNGGRTPRAEKLRRPAGFSYVYLSYGIHHLVNVVTGIQDVASAVLVRGAVLSADRDAAEVGIAGPGRVGAALAVDLRDDGVDLLAGGALRLEPAGTGGKLAGQRIASGPRVGITKAVELPWRFALAGSSGVSAPPLA